MEAEASEKPARTDGPSGSLTTKDLSAIEDEEVLNKMLDETDSFEERRMIRAALRDLLKRKREKREKERGTRQQDLKQQGLSKGEATGTPLTTAKGLKNQQPLQQKPTNKFSPSAPNTSSKLTDGKVTPAVAPAVRCPTSAAPSTKNVKQMLLDWCRAKTEPYEGVEIKNFSSSWRDGIAFCALVHRFFPDAFEYSILDPNNYRENFQLAFSTAEKLANCPPLLDVDDLLRMDEPDWKCVYTYIQEFYRCLVEKGLVKTKKRP